MPKLTKEQFIERARAVHGDKYDYSKVEYVNASTKVCIICPKHAEFWQTPANHMKGNICPECNREKARITQEEALSRINKRLEGTGYIISKDFIYVDDRNTFVTLTCPVHNYTWKVQWHQLVFNYKNTEKYCGCKFCKLTYTKEGCAEAASKCKYRSEFASKFKGEYFAALRNGWLAEICSHMTLLGNRYLRCIYVFEFPNINGCKFAYVGLTDHLEKRCQLHLRKGSVYKFCKEHSVVMPEVKQLTEYLPKERAAELEGFYLEKYVKEGWLPINVKKTGGLGGNTSFCGYSFEECNSIGTKYESRSEWKKCDYSSYYIAQKFKWIDDILPQKERFGNSKQTYWTKERIRQLALGYLTLKEFRTKEPTAYAIACKKNWNEYCFSHLVKEQTQTGLTLEFILEEMRKYDHISSFNKACPQMRTWIHHHKINISDYVTPEFISKEKRTNDENHVHKNAKTVYQYTLEGKLLNTFVSAREAVQYGFDYKKISAVCTGKIRSHKGYIFSFSPNGVTPIERKPTKEKKTRTPRIIKKVQQYTLDGKFIREYSSTSEAASLTGINPKNIQSNVLHKVHTAGGYIWKYSNDTNEVTPRSDVKSPKAIAILQFAKDGTFIREWDSIHDAESEYFPHGKGHITEVCKGKRKFAAGYIWKYKE